MMSSSNVLPPHPKTPPGNTNKPLTVAVGYVNNAKPGQKINK